MKPNGQGVLIRMADFLMAVSAICVLAPVMVLLAAGSALFVGWPPFFLSRRLGKGGRIFRHCKFRSMKPGESWGRSYFEQNRLNRYGKMIRRFHLDELPELFHILSGKMSFVGPRPLPEEHLRNFDSAVREQVPPGWAGLAQLKLLRRGILYGPEQIRLDNRYVARRSLVYNFRILTATFLDALTRRHAPVMDREANAYRKNYRRNT